MLELYLILIPFVFVGIMVSNRCANDYWIIGKFSLRSAIFWSVMNPVFIGGSAIWILASAIVDRIMSHEEYYTGLAEKIEDNYKKINDRFMNKHHKKE